MREKRGLILVSACLVGINCRYDGGNCLDNKLLGLWHKGELFPVCPEELGGLSTPRPNSEIDSGSGEDVLEGKASVKTIEGKDVTTFFVAGAHQTLNIVRDFDITEAIMKSKSPSCGVGTIYRKGRLVRGNGVCAALLLKEGIRLQSI